MDYATAEYALAAGMLVTSMYGMGTTLTARDFIDVARSPLSLLVILVMQWLVAPCLAVLLARMLNVSPGVAAGMLLIVALPGGSYTNLFTYLGRGNVALSVAATTLCTSLCLITTPLVLKLFGQGLDVPAVVMPARLIVAEIGCWLLGPLVAGMATRRFFPTVYATAGRWAIRASLAVMAALFATLLAAGRLELLSQGWRAPLAVLLLAAVSMWLTYGLCLLARRSCPDTLAIAIEVVVRNGNLALLLQASLFVHPIATPTSAASIADRGTAVAMTVGVSAAGVSATGVSADGVSADGVSADGVSADGVSADGVSADGVSADGVSAVGVLYAILVYVCLSLGIACIEVAAHRRSSGVIYGRAAGVRTPS